MSWLILGVCDSQSPYEFFEITLGYDRVGSWGVCDCESEIGKRECDSQSTLNITFSQGVDFLLLLTLLLPLLHASVSYLALLCPLKTDQTEMSTWFSKYNLSSRSSCFCCKSGHSDETWKIKNNLIILKKKNSISQYAYNKILDLFTSWIFMKIGPFVRMKNRASPV